MTEYRIVTALERNEYDRLNERLQATQLPEYLNHDAAVVEYWDRLEDRFAEYQFILVEDHSGEPVGRGQCIPLRYEGEWSELPSGGLDWALERGFLDLEAGREPNLFSALFIVISKDHLGAGLSYRMLAAMRGIGRRKGLEHLVAPVRPSAKHEYPLIPMEDYCRWTRPDGDPHDPWIRVHVRSGGTILHPCSEAMVVRDTVDRWTGWTGLDFPGDGSYIVPGGLVPVSVSLGSDLVSYVEPGVWILHSTESR